MLEATLVLRRARTKHGELTIQEKVAKAYGRGYQLGLEAAKSDLCRLKKGGRTSRRFATLAGSPAGADFLLLVRRMLMDTCLAMVWATL
jgi:hypothetical protein